MKRLSLTIAALILFAGVSTATILKQSNQPAASAKKAALIPKDTAKRDTSKVSKKPIPKSTSTSTAQ